MHNFEYIFKYNKSSKKSKLKITQSYFSKMLVCDLNYNEFGADAIKQIISFVNTLHFRLRRIPLVFKFKEGIKLVDKLSYIIFECICYYLIEIGYSVYVILNCKHDIRTCGIEVSPLNLLSNGACERFADKFKNELYKSHFCMLITEDKRSNKEFLSYLYSDVDCFLKNVGINDEKRDLLSQTILELIGNACEHTDSDCYFDIDVSNNDYLKLEDGKVCNEDSKYYGVNIVILNFSDNLLSDDLKDKLNGEIPNIDRYKELFNAYQYHKSFFSKNYNEDDFFNIAVFQDKISGSHNKNETGGTGLKCLINSLQQKSDSDDCYVLSGKNILYFINNYLSYKKGWIGFNKDNNFFNQLPDLNVINRSKIFFSGTAFNLNFVMKSEDEYE